MKEIIYKGKQSLKDFDITATSVNRPILPALKKRELVIPGIHGAYDFGSNTYEKRIISVMLKFVGQDINDLRWQSRYIAAWLSSTSYQPLIFDDEPDKYYLAKIYDSVGLNTFFRLGEATVTFECLPFALHQVRSGEDLEWDDNLTWNMDISWDNAAVHTVVVTGDTIYDIDYAGTHEVGLGSPRGSKFDIIITGSFSTLSINLNGKTLTYTGPVTDKIIVIDNVDATAKLDGNNVLYNVSGDTISFLKLISGINTATITGTGLNCSVLFDFRPQYL